jgi:hypothetical protein
VVKTPQQIWIAGLGKEPTDWIVERMVSGDIAADGSFDIEASDGPVHVEKGHAVFQVDGGVYACPSRQMSEKLAGIASSIPALQEALAAAPKASVQTAKPKAEPRALKFKPAIGAPCTPANIPIDQLKVDDSYQRSIEGGASQKAIEKIAANWDWRLCLPLLGSRRRDGMIYIIDGQHRKEGAQLRGDIPWLPVVVFDFDDPKDEAELFIQANRSRRAMGKLDDFHAALVAGDEKAVRINRVVTDAGLVIGRNAAWQSVKPGEVVFVRGVEKAINGHGAEIATVTLKMLAEAFSGQTLSGAAALFDGLVQVIADAERDQQPIEFDMMAMVLAEVGLNGWKAVVEGIDGSEDRNAIMLAELRRSYDEARAQ